VSEIARSTPQALQQGSKLEVNIVDLQWSLGAEAQKGQVLLQ